MAHLGECWGRTVAFIRAEQGLWRTELKGSGQDEAYRAQVRRGGDVTRSITGQIRLLWKLLPLMQGQGLCISSANSFAEIEGSWCPMLVARLLL